MQKKKCNDLNATPFRSGNSTPHNGSMSLGLLGRVSSGWRRVIGIVDQGVVWVAPCVRDCWAGRRLGGAVSLGLLGRASSGWRRVIWIADQGVVWAAPCHWDC